MRPFIHLLSPLLLLLLLLLLFPTSIHANQYPLQPSTHDHNALLAFHRNLITIPSTTTHEQQLTAYLASYLFSHAFTVEHQPVPSTPNASGRFNVYAYPNGCPRKTPLLLTTHTDTVPPFYPYVHTNSSIAGRGAVDAKAALAAQVFALLRLLDTHRIPRCAASLLFVPGEETGGDGMHAANHLNTTWDAVIFGEPTENRLAAGHKGVMSFTLAVDGEAGHSGYPWLGVSANEVLVRALGGVVGLADRGGLPWSEKYGNSTVNIGRVGGGVAGNVIAEKAEAELWVRIARGTPEEVERVMNATVERATRLVVERATRDGKKADVRLRALVRGYGVVDLDTDVDIWGDGDVDFTVNYGTDVPNLKGKHKRYLYGPGSILVAHSDHERIEVGELVKGVEGYERLIRGVLERLEEGDGEL